MCEDRDPKVLKLSGLGVDPRQAMIEDKIWNDLASQNPYLDRESNCNLIAQAATNFLNSGEFLYQGTLLTVDGWEHVYNLDRNIINHFQYAPTQALVSSIRNFLSSNQVSVEDTLLILRGDAAQNDYFAEALGAFPRSIRNDVYLRSKVMKAIIDLPVPDGVVIEPVPVRHTQTSSSTASNDGGWGSTNGFNTGSFDGFKTNGFGEFNTGGIQPTSPVQESPQPKQPNPFAELQREWRQVTAKVNGMKRSAFYDKALAELEPFLKQCEQQGATDLIPLVTEKIKELRDKESDNTEEIAKLTREWRPLKATANAKVRIGKVQEGKADFEAFLKRCEQVDAKDLMAEVKVEIAKISTAPSPPPQPPVSAGDLPRDWRNLKATANAKVRGGKVQEAVKEFEAFLKKCEQAGVKDLIPLVKAEIAKAKGGGSTTPPPPLPPVTPLPANTGSLVREWKQAKAAAGGKIRAQKNVEAKKILQDFLAKCTAAGAKDIIAEVKAELAKVK
jgi:biotin-(acetyl-CoA carboxylase) ligase